MKPPVSPSARQQVLDLRRSLSLRQVAEQTGLPLGTVKTICSRSGTFRENPEHRTLFTLPPIQPSTSTALSVPELPPQQVVTGDAEVDAVLWLRSIIAIGQQPLIDKAMELAKHLKTPLAELEKRYTKYLTAKNPGSLFAGLSSMGFDDLRGHAKKSIDKALRRHEAEARFGNTLFHDTPAEQFCIETLAGLKPKGHLQELNAAQVAKRFKARPDLIPNTLTDCLHELAYWHELWVLRSAVDFNAAEMPLEVDERRQFVFGLLAQRRPRNKAEAISVFRYMASADTMDRSETNAILENLIGMTS
jgi:hypothetical protein